MTIGQRIARLRKSAGLSQEALAARLNVSRQAIGKWEADTSLPGLDNLQELARALNVSCDELLTGHAPASPAPQPAEAPTLSLEGVKALLEETEHRRAAHYKHYKKAALLTCALFALLAALLAGNLTDTGRRVDELRTQVDRLTNEMNSIENGIATRMDSIESSIRQSLNEGASILADWDCSTGRCDRATRTVPIRLRAVPRAMNEDTTAFFRIDFEGRDPITLPATRADGAFTAEGDLPLNDFYTVTVGFTSGGVTQSEQLYQERDMDQQYTMVVEFENIDYTCGGVAHHPARVQVNDLSLSIAFPFWFEEGESSLVEYPVHAEVECLLGETPLFSFPIDDAALADRVEIARGEGQTRVDRPDYIGTASVWLGFDLRVDQAFQLEQTVDEINTGGRLHFRLTLTDNHGDVTEHFAP